MCNDQVQKHGCTRKAIEEIIRICVDEDEVARRYYLRVQQQGANGMAVNNALTMLKDGMPIEMIEIVAKYSHLPVSAL